MPSKLKSKVKDPVFGNIAFGDDDEIRRLQKTKTREPDTDKERAIYNGISNWTSSRSAGLAQLVKHQSAIISAADKFPRVLKPKKPNGTLVYRGLEKPSKQLIQTLSKTSRNNWHSVKKETNIMVYEKPITYSPRSRIQSFTYDLDIAINFAWKGDSDIVLITKQNNDFYMNSDVMAIIFGQNEKEVLHFGSSFKSPVYISLNTEFYYNLFRKMSKYTSLSGFAKNLK